MSLIPLLPACNESGGTAASTTSSTCSVVEKWSQNPVGTMVSKGAQSFQVVRAGSFNKFLLYASTSGVTQIDATLYQGGATPDSGTVLATSTLTAIMGNATATWIEFPLPSNPSVTPGVTYYFVFQSTGAALQLGYSAPLNDYPSGDYWSYSGSTWTQQPYDLSFGAGWGC